MFTSMSCVRRFFGAYSSRYIAAPTPTGTVKTAVISMVMTDPASAALMPASSGLRDM